MTFEFSNKKFEWVFHEDQRSLNWLNKPMLLYFILNGWQKSNMSQSTLKRYLKLARKEPIEKQRKQLPINLFV